MSQLDFAQGSSFGPLQIGYSFYIFGVGEISRPPRYNLVLGVLQLRVHRSRKLNFEVLVSKVQHLHIQKIWHMYLTFTLSQSSLGCCITIQTTLEVQLSLALSSSQSHENLAVVHSLRARLESVLEGIC